VYLWRTPEVWAELASAKKGYINRDRTELYAKTDTASVMAEE